MNGEGAAQEEVSGRGVPPPYLLAGVGLCGMVGVARLGLLHGLRLLGGGSS